MSAARYTNRVRTQSQARVTKAQYPGSVSNNYDPLFSSIDCNVSYNVLDYKGVPCICKPASQPFLFGTRLGRINRTAAVQFTIPVSDDKLVIPTLGEINSQISVRMALPATSNDPVPIAKYEKIRNVYVTVSVEHNTVENVPQRSYGTINTNIGVVGYVEKNEEPQAVVVPKLESIRDVRVITQAPVPTASTAMVSYPSYEKLRNATFKIEVPKIIPQDPTPTILPEMSLFPTFEGIRSVGVPVTVSQLTNEPVFMPNYESIRNVRIMAHVPIHIPRPTTAMVSYPSYEKLRNITFKIEVPKTIEPDLATIPKYEKLRNVALKIEVPKSIEPDTTFNLPHTSGIHVVEGLRSVSVPVSFPLPTNIPEHDRHDIISAYHIPEITSSYVTARVDRPQNSYVPNAIPIYDINSFRTNGRFRIQHNNVDTQKELVFGGGSENFEEYVVYGGGNSQLLL
jgi:hypothetical protein